MFSFLFSLAPGSGQSIEPPLVSQLGTQRRQQRISDVKCGSDAPTQTFQALWDLPFDWVEKPNWRRGGWSGVSYHVLDSGERIYLKRQENHSFRDWRRFGVRAPTFRRERRTLRMLAQAGVAVPDMTYYAERREGGAQRAILVTRELDGFVPLHRLLAQWQSQTPSEDQEAVEASAMEACAVAMAYFHERGFQHDSMSGKHLMLRPKASAADSRTASEAGNEIGSVTGRAATDAVPSGACSGIAAWEVCLLDVEKTRRSYVRMRTAVRDFAKLFRHTPMLRLQHRRHLIDAYCKEWPEWRRKWLERQVVRRLSAKGLAERVEGLHA